MQLLEKHVTGAVVVAAFLFIGLFFASLGRRHEPRHRRAEVPVPVPQAVPDRPEVESSDRAMLGEFKRETPREEPEAVQKETKKIDYAKIIQAGQAVIVNRQIRDIERLVELTEDQKQRLTALIAGGIKYRSSITDEAEFFEASKEEEKEISAILGPEASKVYLEEKERKAELNRREWLNDRVVRTFKDLDLSSEQQRSIDRIIDETQQEMKYTGENYRDKRLAGLKRGTELQSPREATDDLYAQTLRDLNSRLKAVLSEDQYQAMIALQTAPRR